MNIRCNLCGRPLKAEKSQQLGYGEVCAIKAGILIKKKGRAQVKNREDSMSLLDIEL